MVGRVVAFVGGKHVDLGEYVGDDAVALNTLGADLFAEAEVAAPKRKPKKEEVAPDPGIDQ
jgi:hypothetical protein